MALRVQLIAVLIKKELPAARRTFASHAHAGVVGRFTSLRFGDHQLAASAAYALGVKPADRRRADDRDLQSLCPANRGKGIAVIAGRCIDNACAGGGAGGARLFDQA